MHLLAHDDDAFNRWEAGQRLAADIILRQRGVPSQAFLDAVRRVLDDTDPAFAAEALVLPSEGFLAEQLDVVDPDALHAAQERPAPGHRHGAEGRPAAEVRRPEGHGPLLPGRDAGRPAHPAQRLPGLPRGTGHDAARASAQFRDADNMTDAMAALISLAGADCPERLPALEAFYAKWKDEPLVVDKWLAVQAASRLPGTLARVRELLAHPAFDLKVPNKVYALIRNFSANHVRFHAADGAGYAFLADHVIELDALNPQVAARMARGFDRWRKFDAGRQAHARTPARAHPRRRRPVARRRRDRDQVAGLSGAWKRPSSRCSRSCTWA